MLVFRFMLWTSAIVSIIMLTLSVMWALLQRGEKKKSGIMLFPPTPQAWSTCQEAVSQLNTFDVIILGSSLSAIILGAILSMIGKRVLVLESEKSLGMTSDKNLSYFGCARYVFLLLTRLVSTPDILATEQLGSKADGFHYLDICLGDSTVSLSADGDTSGHVPPLWWDECRRRCYVGVLSLIILQLLPRWVSEKPKGRETEQPSFFETSDITTLFNLIFGKAKTFGSNVVRRIHAGCVAALRSVAGETTEAYVQRFLDPNDHGALCSSLGGGQSIFTGGILPNESSALLPAVLLCYFEHGAFVFSQGMHAVSLALVETIVMGGGLVCVDAPPYTLLVKASEGSSNSGSRRSELKSKRCVAGVRIDDATGTVLHAGIIVSSLGATTTYLSMQVEEAMATADISGDVSDSNVIATPVNLLTEADLDASVVENAHLRNLTVAARVTIPRSRITVMSEFFHASYNIVSVSKYSKRFSETYRGDISQHQMCYYAFPSPCVVNETMLMILCPRISQAILRDDSMTSSDNDGGGVGDGEGVDVLVLGELPHEWLDVWSADNQEVTALTVTAPETPLDGNGKLPNGSEGSESQWTRVVSFDMDQELAGAEESGDINGSDVTTEGSSTKSISNGDESRFWQDDVGDYRYGDDTEFYAECKCEPQLAEKEGSLDAVVSEPLKTETTSELPADALNVDEVLGSRPCVEKSDSDGDGGILSTAAPAITNHMNQSFVSSFSQACRDRVEALLCPSQHPEAREDKIDGSAEAAAADAAADAAAAAAVSGRTGEDEILVEVIPPSCLTSATTSAATATSTATRGTESTTGAEMLPLYGSYWACSSSLFDQRDLFDGYLHPCAAKVEGLFLCSDDGIFPGILVSAITAWITAVHIVGPWSVIGLLVGVRQDDLYGTLRDGLSTTSNYILHFFQTVFNHIKAFAVFCATVDVEQPLW